MEVLFDSRDSQAYNLGMSPAIKNLHRFRVPFNSVLKVVGNEK